jgi:lipoyl-dependent peroxiredoxin
MERTAQAVWKGTGKDGKGTLTTPSGVLQEAAYSFTTRFEHEKGTNPEELIAAAHAGCFSMALAFALANEGFEAQQLKTDAKITMEKQSNGWSIATVKLTLVAKVANIDEATFQKIAKDAKENCPVSKVLNADITLDAALEG